MDFISAILTLILAIALFVLFKHLQKINYWKRQDVEIISIWELVEKTKRQPWGLVINEYYQQMYKEQRSCKALQAPLISVLIVQDLQAIKDIMVTKYECFPDRGLYVNPKDALSTNLARLDYDLWKPLRNKLSPSFSPAKIKYIFPTFLKVGEEFIQVVKEQCEESFPSSQMEMYDLCARFTTDIMAQVIFGIDCNSLREPHTEFRVQGDRAFYQLTSPLLDILGSNFSKIMQLLNIQVFDKKSNNFFAQIFQENMEYREKNNVRRRDFMDILIDLKKEGQHKDGYSLTAEMMVGQVFALFLGGFETTSCTITYALFEMAKHQEIQQKVRKEISEVVTKYGLTYESLMDMKYLKQVMLETLRKYPIVPNMPRICRQTCTLKTSSGSLTIPQGTSVIIPFYGIQHNPIYYPEPEEFRPERFTEEEIAKRPACTFVPFGAGPKVCIGELFGKVQISLGLAMLLLQFRFSLSEKSPQELSFDPKNMFLLFVKGGVHLKLEKL